MSRFFEEVLTLLRDERVHFIIVGGTAVILHGVPRTTADLDLVVDMDPANLRRLVAAMNRLGYLPRAPVDPLDLCDPARRREWIDEKDMKAFTFVLPGHSLPAEEKLRWLESMRRFLERSLTPEKLEIMQRFRRGDL